jgi:copper homeostasis protein
MSVLLEVIVQSVADARAATEGGADRLEIVRAIDQGGLTPLPSLVRAIAAATPLPLRVMVRENDGYELAPGELPALRRAAAAFGDAGVDGIVIGFARAGEILLDDLLQVIDGLPAVRITFHRAFDSLRDPLATIPRLAAVPSIDRILTSGGDGAASERCAALSRYRAVAAGRLEIIAGGGVDDHALSLFVRERCVRELHVGRAAREGNRADGPVSAARVRHLKALMTGELGSGTRD